MIKYQNLMSWILLFFCWQYAGPAVGYIQQIIVKATVSPWEPNDHEPIDALRAPLNKVFEMLEELNKFRYQNG